jgi:hypothetical protein
MYIIKWIKSLYSGMGGKNSEIIEYQGEMCSVGSAAEIGHDMPLLRVGRLPGST